MFIQRCEHNEMNSLSNQGKPFRANFTQHCHSSVKLQTSYRFTMSIHAIDISIVGVRVFLVFIQRTKIFKSSDAQILFSIWKVVDISRLHGIHQPSDLDKICRILSDQSLGQGQFCNCSPSYLLLMHSMVLHERIYSSLWKQAVDMQEVQI